VSLRRNAIAPNAIRAKVLKSKRHLIKTNVIAHNASTASVIRRNAIKHHAIRTKVT
jgi:hypothetical protein